MTASDQIRPYYQDDLVTLYHGDCREVLPEIDPVDLVLTDPPYGVTYSSNHNAGRGTAPITNDGTRLSLALYRTTIPLLHTEHVLWFTRWDAWPDVWAELGQRFPMRGLLVWDKGHPGMGDLKHWGPSYELIASAGTGKITGSRDGSILRYNAPSARTRLHPTEKPQDLLRYLIEKLDALTVLDPFSGSGSALLAARELGRRAIGIEIDERNCEVIARRLSGLPAPAPKGTDKPEVVEPEAGGLASVPASLADPVLLAIEQAQNTTDLTDVVRGVADEQWTPEYAAAVQSRMAELEGAAA